MKLNARAFGLAAGGVAAALFTLCAFAVAIAPQAATEFFGFVSHLDFTGLARPLTLSSYLVGVLFWSAGTALTFVAAGAFYNRLMVRREAPAVATLAIGHNVGGFSHDSVKDSPVDPGKLLVGTDGISFTRP